ncbi:hypothetical protein GCM10023189_26200 [Nibrella saemangeumensis]|uniref:Uncharacterized protein n=1 Tax=Nibrella saemangeumensis TaxID=1084526 RepID=A0ABP8MZ06_9BACT
MRIQTGSVLLSKAELNMAVSVLLENDVPLVTVPPVVLGPVTVAAVNEVGAAPIPYSTRHVVMRGEV